MPTQMSRIYLIGYRGTGKTTVGRQLAARLGWQFIDADEYLETQQNRTIREIFATHGEPYFRDLEAANLIELSRRDKCVIATGGGIILRAENRATLQNTGFVAWLDGQPQTIWTRLVGDPTTADRRPNLTPQGGITEVINVMSARQPHYAATASVRFDTEDHTPSQLAEAIHIAWHNQSPVNECNT